MKPGERFDEIQQNMRALNLDSGGPRNEYLEAFGVFISKDPLKVCIF